MDQRYCDGVEEISITSGIVRIDFFSYGPGPNSNDGKPPRQLTHRLVLSPEGFVQAFAAFDRIVKQLEEKGLLRRRGDSAGQRSATPLRGARAPAGAAQAAAKGGKSPNF